MAEGTVLLQAKRRTQVGKQMAKAMRNQGALPAVVYGEKASPVTCSVDQKAFVTILHEHGRNAIVDLTMEDGEGHATLIKEIQRHPVSGHIFHVDFHRISLTQKIVVAVPVEVVGTAAGVRNDGGILEHLLHDVDVECLPTAIPERIAYDVSALSIHDIVHASDLVVGDDVRIVTEADRPVIMVVPPTVRRDEDEEAEEAEEAAEEELQEPEVIERGKRDEEEDEA